MSDAETAPARPDREASRPEAPQHRSRERESERTTRKPMLWWDRVKILILLLGAFTVLVWSTIAQFAGLISVPEAFSKTVREQWWLLALAGFELIRQIHFFICERSKGYYRFWSVRVFGGFGRRVGRMNDWTRFRVSRVLKLLFFLFILDLVLAKVLDLSPALAIFQLPVILFQALPFVFQLAFGFFFIMFQFLGLFWFLSRGGVEVYMPDDLETRFSDVKGQDTVLEQVKENIIYLEDPEAIESRGGKVPGGILLWGPPGTGKTLMAQAVAGETSRPFVFVEPGAFINMFMGVGILKVKGLYRKLRKLALRYGGVIVFIDEADSLGNRGASTQGGWNLDPGPWSDHPPCNGTAYVSAGSAAILFSDHVALHSSLPAGRGKDGIMMGGMGGGGMGTLQALLSEMSGLKKPRGFFNRIVRRVLGMRPKPPPKYRILHIFATNMPQSLDEAMLRPGRIDRIYKVGYPPKEGRRATFEKYLGKVQNDLTADQVEKLSIMTPYHTGASIEDMVNEALVIAVRDGRDTVTYRDVLRAKQVKDHGLPDDTEYIERERHAVAVHEACHAVVSYRTRRHALIDMATIERRGDVGGFVSWIDPEDQFVNWRSEYESDIMCSVASLAGERMFFEGDNSAGVGSDLRNATAIAARMEAFYGMGENVASHGVSKYALSSRGGMSAEDGTDRNLLETELGRRVEERLRTLLIRTHALLEENRREVLAVAHALETHRTMSGEDVAAIIDGHQGPLVDGRLYHEGTFRDIAETYHREAVAAHRSHSRPSVSFPVLAPVEVPAMVGPGTGDGESGSQGIQSGNGQPGEQDPHAEAVEDRPTEEPGISP